MTQRFTVELYIYQRRPKRYGLNSVGRPRRSRPCSESVVFAMSSSHVSFKVSEDTDTSWWTLFSFDFETGARSFCCMPLLRWQICHLLAAEIDKILFTLYFLLMMMEKHCLQSQRAVVGVDTNSTHWFGFRIKCFMSTKTYLGRRPIWKRWWIYPWLPPRQSRYRSRCGPVLPHPPLISF